MKVTLLATFALAVALSSLALADDAAAPSPAVAPSASASVPSQGYDSKAPAPIAPTAVAPAPDNSGFFIGMEGGFFWLENFSVDSGGLGINYRFNNGWGLNLPLGYQFDNGLSLSISIGYDNADFEQLTGTYQGYSQGAATNGSVHLVPILANVSYKLHLVGGLNWYIGAGVGAAYSDTSFTSFDDSGARSITFGELGSVGNHPTAVLGGLDNSTWSFAFEAFSGLGYDFTPNFGVQVGYRYTRINDSFSVNGVSGGAFNGNSVEFGITYKF